MSKGATEVLFNEESLRIIIADEISAIKLSSEEVVNFTGGSSGGRGG